MGPSTRRRVAFTVLAVVLFFGLLEGVSWVLEWLVPAPGRTMPTPLPGRYREFSLWAAEERDKAQREGAMVEDAAAGFAMAPDQQTKMSGADVRTNQHGLRGPALTQPIAGEARLVTFGDSSVFGYGVPEDRVFSSVLAVSLGARWGSPVTPIIAANPGHDTGQSLGRLRSMGALLQPSWSIVASMWSDIYAKDPDVANLAEITPAQRGLRRLSMYRMTRRLLAPMLPSARVGFLDDLDDLGDLDGPGGPSTRVSLPQYRDNLRALAAETAALGGRTVFVALPAPMDFDQVEPPVTVLAFRRAMAEVAAELDAPFVDGPAWFHAHGAGAAWFLDNVHPAHNGHALLAEAVEDAIGDLGP